MKFDILRCHGTDRGQWQSLVRRLPPFKRDIHYLPEYGEIYEKTFGFEPCLAFFGDQDKFVIQPFVKRCLNDLPFLRHVGPETHYHDISNPYGYGGPVANTESMDGFDQLIDAFNRQFCSYCRDENFASEFTALSPLTPESSLKMYTARLGAKFEKNVVVVDLDKCDRTIWRQFSRGHKSNIKKAQKNGVTVERLPVTPENIELFHCMYLNTMQRHQAASRWFFKKAYFQNCCDLLGSDNVSLFVSKVEGAIASAYLLMHAFSTAYYHFGASESRYFGLRPNNLLMYETILWAKSKGFLHYHLGGGVSTSRDDPLMQFKRGFSDTLRPLYVYYRVHHRDVYEELCRLKREHEKHNGMPSDERDYFPFYRR
jgi:hypothetical protein